MLGFVLGGRGLCLPLLASERSTASFTSLRCGVASAEPGKVRYPGMRRRNFKTNKLLEQQQRAVGGSAGFTREPIDGLFYPEPRPDASQPGLSIPDGVTTKQWLEHLYGPEPEEVHDFEDDTKRTDLRVVISKDTIDATLVRAGEVLSQASSTDQELGRWRGSRSVQAIELTARLLIGRYEKSQWYIDQNNEEVIRNEGIFISKVHIRGRGSIRAAMFSKVKQVLDIVRDEGYNIGCLDVDAWIRSHRVRRDRPRYESMFMDYLLDGCENILYFALLDPKREAYRRQRALWEEFGDCDNFDEFLDGGVPSELSLHDTILATETRADELDQVAEELRLEQAETERKRLLEDAAASGNVEALIEMSESDQDTEDLELERPDVEPVDDWRVRALIHREVEIVSEVSAADAVVDNFLSAFEGDEDGTRPDIPIDAESEEDDSAADFVLTRMDELPGTFAERGDLVDPDTEDTQSDEVADVLQDGLDEFSDYFEEEEASDRDIDLFEERDLASNKLLEAPAAEYVDPYDEFAKQFSPGEDDDDDFLDDEITEEEVYADNFIDKMQEKAAATQQRGIKYFGVVDQDDLDGDDVGSPFYNDEDVDLVEGEDDAPPRRAAGRPASTNRRIRKQASIANRMDPGPDDTIPLDQEDEIDAIIERDSDRAGSSRKRRPNNSTRRKRAPPSRTDTNYQ